MTAVSLHNIQLTLAILDSLWQYLNWLKRSSLCVLNDFQVIIDILLLYIVMWNPYSYPDLASLFHGNYKDLYNSVLKFIWQYHVIPNFVCIIMSNDIHRFFFTMNRRHDTFLKTDDEHKLLNWFENKTILTTMHELSWCHDRSRAVF